MPVNTTHPLYDSHVSLWRKARDTSAGEEAVKAAGDAYLPQLTGMTPNEYTAYKTRALFFTATGRTIDGLSGAIVRKPAKVEWPKADQERLNDLGVSGESLEQLLGVSVREILTTGRLGLLVDAPPDIGSPQPYVTLYTAEAIINWRELILDGKRTLVMVVLREERDEIDADDPYKHVPVVRYRCLHLGTSPAFTDAEGRLAPGYVTSDIEQNFYYVEVWRENPNAKTEKERWVLEQTIVPRWIGGKLIREIPFVFAGPTSSEPTPEVPPLLDVMNVNLSHYRTSADLEHGRHFTALPTPWFSGFKIGDGGTVRIGAGVGYVADEKGASAGMLEFTGQGLGHLANGLSEKERQMAVLGSRLLEQSKSAVEAADTIKMRSQGEKLSLTLISHTLSEAWTWAMRWVWSWVNASGDTEDILVEFNKEFDLTGLDSTMLTTLMQLVQASLMSWDTFVWNLSRGEFYPEGTDAKKEAVAIALGLPAGMGPSLMGPQSTQDDADEEDTEDPDASSDENEAEDDKPGTGKRTRTKRSA